MCLCKAKAARYLAWGLKHLCTLPENLAGGPQVEERVTGVSYLSLRIHLKN